MLSCVQVEDLRQANHSSKESYRLRKMITELNKDQGPEWAGRAIGKLIILTKNGVYLQSYIVLHCCNGIFVSVLS
jgi:hypothetical protein